MGGDGGVVATNRRYLRGAGTADHTGDSKRVSSNEIVQAEKERLQQMMKTCAIQGSSLHLRCVVNSNNIVACPYGRLYNKETAIQALLKRHSKKKSKSSTQSKISSSVEIGWHVRGLKDLYPVHFYYDDNNKDGNVDKVATCPISGVELNGSTYSAFLIINSNKDIQQQPNVLSEKAIKEMGHRALQEEYGPFERLLRLAPSLANGEFDQICQEWEMKIQEEESKKKKKKKKNNKRNNEKSIGSDKQAILSKKSKTCKPDNNNNINISASNLPHNQNKLTTAARSNVAAAVNSNSVFSSLFQSKQGTISDKEKRDNLFVR